MTPAEYIAAMNLLLGLIKIIQSQKVAGEVTVIEQQALIDEVDRIRASIAAPPQPHEVVDEGPTD